MFPKISISRMFSILLVVVMISGSAAAQSLNAPLGTGFTYQGRLSEGGSPANGVYRFQFKLFDDLTGGVQKGSTLTFYDQTVTNGLFTISLDFGNEFDGTPLFLEVSVGVLEAGAYVFIPLTPRQALTPTPYAIYAEKAPWSGLTGVPAGFADGVDNGSSYQNIKVVAKSGGDFTTITAALNSITTNSTSNHYLIYVAPGVYNEPVTMKPFVDIEGAGELTTKITFTGSGSTNTGTLLGADNAEVRFLTVESTGVSGIAIAIYNSGAAPRLTHVTASAFGGLYNYGVINVNSSSPVMTDVTASASGGMYSYGVNNSSSSPAMTGVTASASGGTNDNYGVFNYASSPTMTNVTASASGGTYNTGIMNDTSSATINNSVISASGGVANVGIYNNASSGAYTVLVNNSQISGSTNTILNDTEFTTRVGASQLSGGAVSAGGGTLTCAGVYDEAYTFYASTCP